MNPSGDPCLTAWGTPQGDPKVTPMSCPAPHPPQDLGGAAGCQLGLKNPGRNNGQKSSFKN